MDCSQSCQLLKSKTEAKPCPSGSNRTPKQTAHAAQTASSQKAASQEDRKDGNAPGGGASNRQSSSPAFTATLPRAGASSPFRSRPPSLLFALPTQQDGVAWRAALRAHHGQRHFPLGELAGSSRARQLRKEELEEQQGQSYREAAPRRWRRQQQHLPRHAWHRHPFSAKSTRKEPAPKRSPPLPLHRRVSGQRAGDGAPADWLWRPGEVGGERGSSAKLAGLSREWRWRARCFFSPCGWVRNQL